MCVTSSPSSEVLRSFGLDPATLRPASGGQGTTWTTGDVFLKPVADVAEAEWVAAVLHDLPEAGFRLSRPLRTSSGSWTAAGWACWRRVDGVHDLSGRWLDVLAVTDAFHRALVGVARPLFLDDRNDVWSIGDRAAWNDEQPRIIHSSIADAAEELARLRQRTRVPSQVIHGDVTGNVLFAAGCAPAVIDFVPYWRPAQFAPAIVVADAIAWYGADPDLAQHLAADDRRSMLARAALYRLITADRAAVVRVDDSDRYLRDHLRGINLVIDALRAL